MFMLSLRFLTLTRWFVNDRASSNVLINLGKTHLYRPTAIVSSQER